jgi:hypothetical protein
VKEIVKRALKIRNFVYDKLQIKNEFVFIDWVIINSKLIEKVYWGKEFFLISKI